MCLLVSFVIGEGFKDTTCFITALQTNCITHYQKKGIVQCIWTKKIIFKQSKLKFCLQDDYKEDQRECVKDKDVCPQNEHFVEKYLMSVYEEETK